jgi:hypothetical protein
MSRDVTVRVISEHDVPVDRVGEWIDANLRDEDEVEIIDRGPDQ